MGVEGKMCTYAWFLRLTVRPTFYQQCTTEVSYLKGVRLQRLHSEKKEDHTRTVVEAEGTASTFLPFYFSNLKVAGAWVVSQDVWR